MVGSDVSKIVSILPLLPTVKLRSNNERLSIQDGGVETVGGREAGPSIPSSMAKRSMWLDPIIADHHQY